MAAEKSKKPVNKEEWETTAEEDKFCPICGAYDPEQKMFKSRDTRGQSVLTYVRVPPDVLSQLEQIVQSGKFVYKTIQEIIREAIGHRLFYLSKRISSEALDDTLVRLAAVHDLIEEEERMSEYQRELDKLDALVSAKLNEGAQGRKRAVTIVRRFYDQVSRMKDPYYQEVFTQRLENKFHDLLRERTGGKQ